MPPKRGIFDELPEVRPIVSNLVADVQECPDYDFAFPPDLAALFVQFEVAVDSVAGPDYALQEPGHVNLGANSCKPHRLSRCWRKERPNLVVK